MSLKDELSGLIEIELHSNIISITDIGPKKRFCFVDKSYFDLWISESIPDRFGFHYERRHIDSKSFRYDNFPDVNFDKIEGWPFHFHDGSQEEIKKGCLAFILWIKDRYFND